ncbi:MAG: alkaline phosphatase family protein [Lacunisphaera sp.]
MCVASGLLGAAEETPPPRLAVVISVDQMRADYLERFRPYFGEDGFKRLTDQGAWFKDSHYQHAVTKTAPGHATILSGVHANVHGIIANEWLDRRTFIQGNNVEDANAPLVGLPPRLDRYANATFAAKAGRSPRNLLGVTVGDRLKARYGGSAKVFGVADKDRAAILMSGSKADGAYWTEEGGFVTSTYYRLALPDWLAQFNAERGAARHFGQVWDRLLDPAVYDRVQGPDDAPGEAAEDGLPVTFPKKIDGGKPQLTNAYFDAFDHTPWDNDLVEDMVERLVAHEHLGEDNTPDLLCVGFSQPDRAGHAYGPDSHEIMDTYLRLDRTLAKLFQFLDGKVGRGRYVLVLTADHGVAPLPEKIQRGKGRGRGRTAERRGARQVPVCGPRRRVRPSARERLLGGARQQRLSLKPGGARGEKTDRGGTGRSHPHGAADLSPDRRRLYARAADGPGSARRVRRDGAPELLSAAQHGRGLYSEAVFHRARLRRRDPRHAL